VQHALASGEYDGAIWLEGSPNVEETSYWLNLLIDTRLPICGNASQRPHGAVGNEGDRNIVDSVNYITSRVWAGADGSNELGVVVIQDQRIFSAREVQKGDARPGGYVVTGGHGGILGGLPEERPPTITFRPAMRHTFHSALALPRLPATVTGLGGQRVRVKDGDALLASAIPAVTFVKQSRYSNWGVEEIEARIAANLSAGGLAGFVGEGQAPYGTMNQWLDKALEKATFSGMPVVKVGRGDQQGFAQRRNPLFIAGSNLTATKARLLLMAALLKLGALPAADDPLHPSAAEADALRAKLEEFQEIFDTH
ncbi:MAG TPA: asparaginase domain-containing protein, partial [Chloroflexota bacterium]